MPRLLAKKGDDQMSAEIVQATPAQYYPLLGATMAGSVSDKQTYRKAPLGIFISKTHYI